MALECIQCHVKVGEGMLDLAQKIVDPNLDGQLFMDFAAQAGGEFFAGPSFAAGELPQAAKHPVQGALGDQEVTASVPDDPSSHIAMRALCARGSDGQIVLNALAPGLAPLAHWTEQAARG